MLSKTQLKLITSLKLKKYRNKHGLFVVEGKKSVLEFLSNTKFEVETLFATSDTFMKTYSQTILITESELKKISFLKSPNEVLAVFRIPKQQDNLKEKGLLLALDDVKDPGNLGTIIRLCDWFDVDQLICSLETVDCYNPKVIQASMGSLTRVSVVYTDLGNYIEGTRLPVYGTLLEGENVYKTNLPDDALIIMGNEANGISSLIKNKITQALTIPKFGDLQQTESLNVATATAIILSEFKR